MSPRVCANSLRKVRTRSLVQATMGRSADLSNQFLTSKFAPTGGPNLEPQEHTVIRMRDMGITAFLEKPCRYSDSNCSFHNSSILGPTSYGTSPLCWPSNTRLDNPRPKKMIDRYPAAVGTNDAYSKFPRVRSLPMTRVHTPGHTTEARRSNQRTATKKTRH